LLIREKKYGGHMRKYGGHMGKYGQNIMVNIIPRTYGKMHRTYGKMKKYEKISKKYLSDIWENMADIWQQNTSRTMGKYGGHMTATLKNTFFGISNTILQMR
jgi:hypothetical protein